MTKLEELIVELTRQNSDESVGDLEESCSASMMRGNVQSVAEDLGYDLSPYILEDLQGLNGAIVYTNDDEISVETFEDESTLDERWDSVASQIEASLDTNDL